MRAFEQIIFGIRGDYGLRIARLREAMRHLPEGCRRANGYRKHIALYEDLLAVVDAHVVMHVAVPDTLPVAKPEDVNEVAQ